MFVDWTPREKRLYIAAIVLVVLLCGLVVHTWQEKSDTTIQHIESNTDHGYGSDSVLTSVDDVDKQVVDEDRQVEATDERNDPTERVAHEEIVFDIKGAVQSPGVYALEEGTRIIDAIERAGGVSDAADTSVLNLAEPLRDGMVVYVPTGEEVSQMEENDASFVLNKWPEASQMNGGSDKNAAADMEKVNINQATQAELETLSGIGPSRASAIIQYRDEHGPFQHIDQLQEISGIGTGILERIREDITY